LVSREKTEEEEGEKKMRKSFQPLITAVSIVLIVSFLIPVIALADESCNAIDRAKNIIFMVPDGMGLSNVTAARIFNDGPNGAPLYLETLPQIGYQRTHSADSTVTDSAAAASAWACGEKFNNNEICCLDNNKDTVCESAPKTILEMAKEQGKATGLVATSTITHATPAVWGAHVYWRNCETEIARQYIEATGVDVILGGVIGSDRSACLTPSPRTAAQIISEAQATYGYTYAVNKAEMDAAVASEKMKVLGLFGPSSGKTPETYRVDPVNYSWPSGEPTLPEMTAAALDILEKDQDGFFLMVEGSQIDWANHANDLSYQIGETLAFDKAVKIVLDWINAKPMRKMQTLIIIVADHDCGGFAVNGPYGMLSEAGEVVEAGWTSLDHTAQDTIIWSQGPGSNCLGKAVDNTDLYQVMKAALK
jgi:alkaline phosphatase